jgi:hypothetical protein
MSSWTRPYGPLIVPNITFSSLGRMKAALMMAQSE